ncbi:spidroin-1-like [Eucalyptus grandis]|uniref:spidroin-1-like n=1 Tax=Eucalyptus grandis TaxID=71139 RepID=UPI00192EE6F0|nr:spidroin-1-like [Eucalyptus grandis]
MRGSGKGGGRRSMGAGRCGRGAGERPRRGGSSCGAPGRRGSSGLSEGGVGAEESGAAGTPVLRRSATGGASFEHRRRSSGRTAHWCGRGGRVGGQRADRSGVGVVAWCGRSRRARHLGSGGSARSSELRRVLRLPASYRSSGDTRRWRAGQKQELGCRSRG